MRPAQRTMRFVAFSMVCSLPVPTLQIRAATVTPPASAPAANGDDLELAALEDARDRMRWAIARHQATPEFRVDELLTARGVPLDRIDELLEECSRAGPMRIYRDGTVEVYLLLSEGKLTAALRRWLGDGAAAAPFASAANQTILVSGCAAPAPRDAAAAPFGWEALPPEARRLAEEAARVEARLALIERLRRLRVEPGVSVSDLIGEWPTLGWALSEANWKLSFGALRFTPDFRCFIRAELSMDDAARGLRAALNRSGRQPSDDAANGDVLRRLNGAASITAIGVAAPPPDMLAASRPPEPAWASACLTAVGEAALGAPDRESKTAPDEAINRARADAIEKLKIVVRRLEPSSGLTLESLMRSHEELRADVDEFLRRTVELRPAVVEADGCVRMTLAIPARRLWRAARPYVSAPVKRDGRAR